MAANLMLPTIPSVSICIPTYKGAAHLGRTIDSVLGQSYADFELVVIDDNSPDNTADVVAAYRDPRIRYLRNTSNLGPQGNWNRCLNEALGKYFKLLPHDDLLMPQCLERQVAVLEQDTEKHIALVFSSRKIINAYDQQLAVRGYPGGKSGIIPAKQMINRCIRWGTNLIGEPGSVLCRRKLTEQIGSFDASQPYVIDLDYWFRLLLKGDAYYIAEPMATFRVFSGSWSVAIGSRQSVEYCEFIGRMARNPQHSIGRYDIIVGKFMAHVNKFLRLVFYRFALK